MFLGPNIRGVSSFGKFKQRPLVGTHASASCLRCVQPVRPCTGVRRRAAHPWFRCGPARSRQHPDIKSGCVRSVAHPVRSFGACTSPFRTSSVATASLRIIRRFAPHPSPCSGHCALQSLRRASPGHTSLYARSTHASHPLRVFFDAARRSPAPLADRIKLPCLSVRHSVAHPWGNPQLPPPGVAEFVVPKAVKTGAN
jgi:hypothetical protein